MTDAEYVAQLKTETSELLEQMGPIFAGRSTPVVVSTVLGFVAAGLLEADACQHCRSIAIDQMRTLAAMLEAVGVEATSCTTRH